MVFNGFKGEVFPIKPTEHTGQPDMFDCIVKVFDHEPFTS